MPILNEMPTDSLTFHYPNGRVYELIEESETPLALAAELERFGRTWRVAETSTPYKRRLRISLGQPEAFECYPVSSQRVLGLSTPGPELLQGRRAQQEN